MASPMKKDRRTAEHGDASCPCRYVGSFPLPPCRAAVSGVVAIEVCRSIAPLAISEHYMDRCVGKIACSRYKPGKRILVGRRSRLRTHGKCALPDAITSLATQRILSPIDLTSFRPIDQGKRLQDTSTATVLSNDPMKRASTGRGR